MTQFTDSDGSKHDVEEIVIRLGRGHRDGATWLKIDGKWGLVGHTAHWGMNKILREHQPFESIAELRRAGHDVAVRHNKPKEKQ